MNNQRAIDAEKLANDILTFVNSYGYDADTFAKTIAKGHKTLQQSTIRSILMIEISKRWNLQRRLRNLQRVIHCR